MDSLAHFHSRNVYFYIHNSNSLKVTHSLCFKKNWVHTPLKGCGMGPRLVLVSPCFRENVVATCKIGSFLCRLDNLLQKNVIVLFFLRSNFKMALS